MRRILLVAVGLALLALAVRWAFGPALSGSLLAWDDYATLSPAPLHGSEPPLGFALGATPTGHWQPLAWLSYWLELRGGLAPDAAAARMHGTNLVLHGLGAAALWLLGARLLCAALPAARRGLAESAAFGAALLWAVHPLRAESVAWITERRDVLAAPLLFLALWAWLRSLEGDPEPRLLRRDPWAGLALACFALSLASKAWGVSLPLVLVLLDRWPLGRARFGLRRLVLEKLPWVLLALPAAWLAARAQAGLEAGLPNLAQHGIGARALQALHGLAWYAQRTLWPAGLSALVELPESLRAADVTAALFLVPAGAALAFGLRRRAPALAIALCTYGLLLLPVLGFFQAGPQLVAARYAHLASVPLFLLAAGAAALVLRRPALLVGLALLVSLALVGETRRRAADFQSDEALWSRVVEVERGSFHGHLGLAAALEAPPSGESELEDPRARFGQAAIHYAAAAGVRPADPRPLHGHARVLALLAELEPERAVVLRAESRALLERAVELAFATGKVSPEARLAHARTLLDAGRAAEALPHIEVLRELNPADPDLEALEARARSLLGTSGS